MGVPLVLQDVSAHRGSHELGYFSEPDPEVRLHDVFQELGQIVMHLKRKVLLDPALERGLRLRHLVHLLSQSLSFLVALAIQRNCLLEVKLIVH